MTAYTLISSDSHIIEPADLWEQRIDRRFKDRAPHLVHEGTLDQWYADGVKFGNIGTNQQAGLRFEAPEKLTVARQYGDHSTGSNCKFALQEVAGCQTTPTELRWLSP